MTASERIRLLRETREARDAAADLFRQLENRRGAVAAYAPDAANLPQLTADARDAERSMLNTEQAYQELRAGTQ